MSDISVEITTEENLIELDDPSGIIEIVSGPVVEAVVTSIELVEVLIEGPQGPPGSGGGGGGGTAADTTFNPTGALSSTNVQAALAELDTEKSNTGHAHTASTVTFTPTGAVAATTVQTAIQELDSEKSSTSHTHSAQTAAATPFTPTGTLGSTTVQDAIVEAAGEAAGGITFQDEGTPLASLATTVNLVGPGVDVTGTGATKTVTIPGEADIFLVNSTPTTSFSGAQTDASSAIEAAIAAAGANGGGVVLLRPGFYRVTRTIVINVDNVVLASASEVPGAWVFDLINSPVCTIRMHAASAVTGPVLNFTNGALGRRLYGVGLRGVVVSVGTGSNAASIGVGVRSVAAGSWAFGVSGVLAGGIGVDLTVDSSLGAGQGDNQANKFDYVAVAASGNHSGKCIHLDGSANSNTSLNVWDSVSCYYGDGHGIDLDNVDGEIFNHVRMNRISGSTTGRGVIFRNDPAGTQLQYARRNTFVYLQPGTGGVEFESNAAGASAPLANQILSYSQGNGSAAAIWGAGSTGSIKYQSGVEEVDGVVVSAISGVTVQEEGSPLATPGTTFNFTGIATASGTGSTKTINIPSPSDASTSIKGIVQLTNDFEGTATSPVVKATKDIFPVEKYGAVGDGTTDDTTSIQNAVNAATTNGGGIVLFRQSKTYKVITTITINGDNVVLAATGEVPGTWLFAPTTAPAAIIVMAAASTVTGPVLNFTNGNFGRRIYGVGIKGILVDMGASGFGSTVGVALRSVACGSWNFGIHRVKDNCVGLDLTVDATLAAGQGENQENRFDWVSVTSATHAHNGKCIRLSGDANNNTSMNHWGHVSCYYSNGGGIDLDNCDGEFFSHVRMVRVAASTTGVGVTFRNDPSSSSGTEYARYTTFAFLQPGAGGVVFEGSASGTANAPDNNTILAYSQGNSSPTATWGTGATGKITYQSGTEELDGVVITNASTSSLAALKAQATTTVIFTDPATARPTGWGGVVWVGPSSPTNAAPTDLFVLYSPSGLIGAQATSTVTANAGVIAANGVAGVQATSTSTANAGTMIPNGVGGVQATGSHTANVGVLVSAGALVGGQATSTSTANAGLLYSTAAPGSQATSTSTANAGSLVSQLIVGVQATGSHTANSGSLSSDEGGEQFTGLLATPLSRGGTLVGGAGTRSAVVVGAYSGGYSGGYA